MLTPEIVAAIRNDCEGRSTVLREQQASNRHDKRMEKRGVVRGEDGEPDPMHQVPLRERPTVIKYGIKNPKDPLPENLSEYARHAIDFLRTNRKWFGVYSEPLPRLAQGRQQIIEAVASYWNVPERTVRSIWESKVDV
jgi:hypothetical protein